MAFKRVSIPLSCDYKQFLANLSSEIAEPVFGGPNGKQLFKGFIKNDEFKIWENNLLRGFEPITFGKYMHSGERRLVLFMRISMPAIVITILLYAIFLFQIINQGFNSVFLIFLIAPIIMALISFYPDCRKVEIRLRDIIKKTTQTEHPEEDMVRP